MSADADANIKFLRQPGSGCPPSEKPSAAKTFQVGFFVLLLLEGRLHVLPERMINLSALIIYVIPEVIYVSVNFEL